MDATQGPPPLQFSGVVPGLSVQGDMNQPRSECGVGALMPWAGRLWLVSYVAHKKTSGSGTGLYEIDESFRMRRRPESVVGTYANRMVHFPSNQLCIGPHVIDAAGKVRTIEPLIDIRITATCEHLREPDRLVYQIGMEGEVFETDVKTLECRQVFDLVKELKIPDGAQPHFKGAFAAHGRLVVTNNTHDENEFLGKRNAGRLAEFDGKSWTILANTPFYEVYGRKFLGGVLYAAGWDRASAILKVCVEGNWTTYRLPKASHNYEHLWQHEWPRIREVEHERILADIQGMFYELSPHAFGGRVWGIRPICTHLVAVSDFVNYRGVLVVGSNQMTPFNGDNVLAGEPDSGVWCGKTDDLWNWGRPKGWGGPWWKTPVAAGQPSDPYLMFGFGDKCLYLTHDAARTVRFGVEIDFLGDGSWARYQQFEAPPGQCVTHSFPPGFAPHWVRLVADADCTATAQLTYV